MKPIDIRPADLETVRTVLGRHVPDRQVRAFGSRVTWTAKEFSDLDLAVMGDKPLSASVSATLRDAFSESNLPFKVDIVDWATTKEKFRQIIEKEFVVLQKGQVKGGMEGEYPIARVGDLADSISDTHRMEKEHLIFLNTSDILQGKFLHRTYTAVKDWPGQAKKSIRINDILFSEIRPANGRWAFVEEEAEDFVVSTKLMVIRSHSDRVLPEFLYQYLTSSEIAGWLQHLAESRSGTFPQITFDQVASLELPLPPLPEQRAIAHILGTLDDKIELNRRMNETLEAMARALFKSWFVDFDPVRAKADGRNPGLPKHIADLFPDSFEDSELGEIPKGWKVGSILDHARLLSGGTPKTDKLEYWNGSVPWASAKDVSQSTGSFLVVTERSITQRGVDESATQIIPALCSVVVARGATTGRMVLFGRAMAMNQTCYALMTTTETPFALYCRLREEIDTLVHAAHGSVFDTITTSTFKSSRIVLPPPFALKAFEERTSPIFLRVLSNINESRTLAAQRDALLPKLISGELRVKDAERFIKGARLGLGRI